MIRRRIVLAALVAFGLAPAAASGAAVGPQLGPGALNRYVDAESYHLVTPAPVAGAFAYEATLGYTLGAGGPNRRALYGCANSSRDQFLSTDSNCENRSRLGAYGFVYDTPPAGEATVPLYRCITAQDHFASSDANCEGQKVEGRLGFLRARGDALLRFYDGRVHHVTAGPVEAGFGYELGLGFFVPGPGEGRRAIYGCRAGPDRFLSRQSDCEGSTPLGLEGYAYDAPPPGEETAPVYRCLVPGTDHFASRDPGCEGMTREDLLGYLRVRGDALVRYENADTGTSWVTAGTVGAGFRFVRTLGFPQRIGGPDLTPVFGCTVGPDHFLSPDGGCEGQTGLGREGFLYGSPPGDQETIALYRCLGAGRGHFASEDPQCEGARTEARLGYVRTIDQGPPPPPSCGPSGAKVALGFGVQRPRALRSVGFGRSASVTGRATGPDGAPAGGATVTLLTGDDLLSEVGRTQAGPDGAFAFTVGPGANRTLRAGFRAAAGDVALACSAPIDLRVRAGVRLRVSKRRARNGQRVRFSGSVLGEPIPRKGKLLFLQAFVRGRWVTFATPRTNPQGAFRGSYRFKATTRSRTFRFRVRAPSETAFPYERGTSRTLKVRVRP